MTQTEEIISNSPPNIEPERTVEMPELEHSIMVETERLEDMIPAYVECEDLGIYPTGELHEFPIDRLAIAVKSIVTIEGPVHVDDIIRRLREAWGLSRAGDRIKRVVMSAISYADSNNEVKKRRDFVWASELTDVKVRKRSQPKIHLVCDQEITAAVKMILESHLPLRLKS